MKTILVGVDFAEGEARVFEKAREMATHSGGRLFLLHVLEPVDEPGSEDPETQEFYRELEDRSQVKLDDLLTRATGLQAESSIRVGHRHVTILDVADEVEADLIVLGSRPLEPDSTRFGTSHRVAVTSHRTVMLVP